MKRILYFAIFLSALSLQMACNKDDANDKNKPFIVINGNPYVNWPLGSEYVDQGAKVFDVNTTNDTIDISYQLNTTTNIDANLEGTYEVKYNASDEDGNNADEKIRTVKVLIAK